MMFGPESTRSTPRRVGKLPWAAGALLAAIAASAVLFDPVSFLTDWGTTARVRRELPRALERWQSQGVESYTIHAAAALPLTCLIDGEIRVEAGQLADVWVHHNPLVPDSPLVRLEPEAWQANSCPIRDLMVPAMFARLQDELDRGGLAIPGLDVHFDQQYGYITEYHSGRPAQRGLFGPAISDCCIWFSFDRLTLSRSD